LILLTILSLGLAYAVSRFGAVLDVDRWVVALAVGLAAAV